VKYISVESDEWEREPDIAAIERAGRLDDVEAELEYKALVERGSMFSMLRLAHIFEFRDPQRGGPDFAQAECWYCKAVNSGSAVATLHCGYFYLRRKNHDRARDIFCLGVERKYAPSMVRLAHQYIFGLGVPRDLAEARALLRQASELGNLWAKTGLARMDWNSGETLLVRMKGLVMCLVSDLQFYCEKRRAPGSERLVR
jgi:TPR repeat protein